MSWIAAVYVVYAAVLLAGGVMGFVKAQSLPSLIAGIVSGALAVVAAVLLNLHHPRSGLGLGIALSAVMEVVFLVRYQRTRKAMPALPMLAASSGVFVASVVALVLVQGRHG